MRRTTVLLPDGLMALLDRERRRRDVAVATIIREAVEAYLLRSGSTPPGLPFVGIGHSGQRDVARDAEAILSREWSGDDLARGRSR